MDKLSMESPDMTAQNIDRIAALFPNCITEMLDEEHSTPEKKVYKRAVNFELLKQMLSPDVVDGDEAYEFTWVGKKAAIVEANKPIRKTLRPVLKDETIPTGADSEGKPYCSSGSKDWDTTENLYIEGDNLEVLKLLQESYLGKVKMIYIDPPYNTGNDFIYADDFMRSQEEENEQMGMYDEDENRLFKNTDTNGRFHSDWCSMIYSRLMLARNLLMNDGVIFISIDDGEVENLRKRGRVVFGKDHTVTPKIRTNLFEQNTEVMRSVQFSYAQTATQQFNKLFDGKRIFENPKNTADIKKLLAYITSDEADGIILDFFSGSATTAHAVMQLNAEDGGHRKFIMVQLPEPCDKKSEAYKAGYKNICEIGKERIRRAGEKIQEARLEAIALSKHEWDQTCYYVEHQEECDRLGHLPDEYFEKEHPPIDTGFRVLKLDDTNMKDVYYAPDDYDQGMIAGLESNIKDDRTDLDLLFGCLIDWGLPLSLPYKSEQLGGCTVHTYNDGDLIACFDANIPESVVKEIAQRRPLRAVFRDSGFASSPEKINVFEIFKLYMPEDANDISKRVRVI